MAGTLLSGTICCVSYLINAAGESFSDWRLSAESLSMGVWRRAVDLRVQIYTMAQALKAFPLHSLTYVALSPAALCPFPLRRLRPQGLKLQDVHFYHIKQRFMHVSYFTTVPSFILDKFNRDTPQMARSLAVALDVCLFLASFACFLIRSSIQYISRTHQFRRGQCIYIRPRRFSGSSSARFTK